MKIPVSELRFSSLSLMDAGRVFRWNNELYRAIPKESSQRVRELFQSGLIPALVAEGLFISSEITDLELEGYALVVRHELVPVVSYPREWSYSMLREAALLVLRVNEVASRFGYQTQDCHGYNVLFRCAKPVYVDLGSFVRVQGNCNRLLSVDEFLRAYYFPLKLWAVLGANWGERLVPRPGYLLKLEDYLKLNWRTFRVPPLAPLHAALSRASRAISVDDDQIAKSLMRRPRWQAQSFLFLRARVSALFTFSRLRMRVLRIRRRFTSTAWNSYHDPHAAGVEKLSVTPRFKYVMDFLLSCKVTSVLEIAGNQGVLSRILKKADPSIQVTCTDADESAIDQGYRLARSGGEDVNWAVLNPFFREEVMTEESAVNRFRAEAVVALALTHHLILSMNLQAGWILDVLSTYTSKYVLVEFMPLGLFDGKSMPDVPVWYTEDWFRTEFESRFNIIDRLQLEKNRVLFIGELKTLATSKAFRDTQ